MQQEADQKIVIKDSKKSKKDGNKCCGAKWIIILTNYDW
jgi:hypothetical protein